MFALFDEDNVNDTLDPPLDRFWIGFTPNFSGYTNLDTCETKEEILAIGIQVHVPSYKGSDGIDFWQTLIDCLESVTDDSQNARDLGINNITSVTPAVGLIPGTKAQGGVSISLHRYRGE